MKNRITRIIVLGLIAITSPVVAQQPLTIEQQLRLRREAEGAPATTADVFRGQSVQVTGDTRMGQIIMTTPGQVQIFGTPQVTENAAFLGVAGVPVDPALREQLGLKKGLGVVVERVEQASPAEEAGVKQYDIIEKFDDQLLVNGQQLAVLVRTHSAGDQIKLVIIRQGQRKEVAVKLIEKEVPTLDEKNLWGMPNNPWDTAAKSLPGSGTLQLYKGNFNYADKVQNLFTGRDVSMKMIDGNYTFSFTTKDGELNLQAKDTQGNVIYDGPVETDAQVKQLPPEIAERVKPMLGKLEMFRAAKTARPKP